jgi:hypothetical protein
MKYRKFDNIPDPGKLWLPLYFSPDLLSFLSAVLGSEEIKLNMIKLT